jgi:formate hydrogenlyase subunit 6/NADH:ubiquinone oxidoreductase subunit I
MAGCTVSSGMAWPTAVGNLFQAVRALRIAIRRGFGKRARPAANLPFRGPPLMHVDASGQPICTTCGVCVGACPTSAIRISQAQGVVQIHLDWRRCACCSICIRTCPVQALEARSGLDTSLVICSGQGGPDQ